MGRKELLRGRRTSFPFRQESSTCWRGGEGIPRSFLHWWMSNCIIPSRLLQTGRSSKVVPSNCTLFPRSPHSCWSWRWVGGSLVIGRSGSLIGVGSSDSSLGERQDVKLSISSSSGLRRRAVTLWINNISSPRILSFRQTLLFFY